MMCARNLLARPHQVEQIRDLTRVFKRKGWESCMTCAGIMADHADRFIFLFTLYWYILIYNMIHMCNILIQSSSCVMIKYSDVLSCINMLSTINSPSYDVGTCNMQKAWRMLYDIHDVIWIAMTWDDMIWHGDDVIWYGTMRHWHNTTRRNTTLTRYATARIRYDMIGRWRDATLTPYCATWHDADTMQRWLHDYNTIWHDMIGCDMAWWCPGNSKEF